MLRSAPGADDRLAGRPAPCRRVAGKCGRSPAIRRSTVDLPQPDGPRIAMNSPLSGTSGTVNVTSWMTVRLPKRFVTPLEIDDVRGGSRGRGLAHHHSSTDAVREQAALEPEQQAVDAVREQADDDEDQDDVLGQAAPLAGHQQVAEAVLRVDQLGQHDVAERQAEQVPQAVVDVGQRERDEHLAHDLQRRWRRASARSRRSGRARSTTARDRVREDERHAGDEDEHHLLRLVDAEPEDRQRDQRGDRQVAAEERERRAGRLEHAPGPGDDPERHADERPRARSRSARASSVAAMLCEQRAVVQQAGKAANTSRGLGRMTGEIEPLLRRRGPSVASHQSSTTTPSAAAPTSRRAIGGGGERAASSSDGLRVGRHLLGGRRRLRRVDLDLHAAVLRVVVGIGRIGRPVPAHARRRELVRLERSGTSGPAPPSPRWRGSATAP